MSSVKCLSLLALFLIFLAVLPGLPPHVEFEAFSVTPAVPLTGALALNTELNNAERLLEDKIHGPKSLQVHKGQLYTALHGGQVVRILGDKVEFVTKFGQPCEGFHEEDKCGRPLGMKFDKGGNLYVADAYYGIFKVNVSTGKSKNLVSMNNTIDGKRPMVPTSVAVDDDGSVYWTDSSTTHYLHDGIFSVLASGSGRLLKYWPSTGRNTVLLDKIHFPKGLALSDDGSFLVICEMVGYRILKYHVKGSQAGKSEVFVDGLPGFPDNIRSDGNGGFIISLVYPRHGDTIFVKLGPYPIIRKLAARILHLIQCTVVFFRDLFSSILLKRAAHYIGHFESFPPPSPPRATVLFLTKNGTVSRSLFATDGLTAISDLVEFEGYFYLGSPFNKFLARVKAI